MAEHDLRPDVDAALRAVRATRGACPPAEALVAYDGLDSTARPSHAIHDHVQVCSRCQLVLLHLTPDEEAHAGMDATAGRTAPWWSEARWGLATAAVIVVGFVVFFFSQPALAPQPQRIAVRGNELQPVAPVGHVPQVTMFVWGSPLAGVRYRLEVYRHDRLLASVETTNQAMPADALPAFEPNVGYAWQVHAIDAEGTVRMSSPRQRFQLTK